jgi:hypothetical protein
LGREPARDGNAISPEDQLTAAVFQANWGIRIRCGVVADEHTPRADENWSQLLLNEPLGSKIEQQVGITSQ